MRSVCTLLLAIWILPCAAQKHKQQNKAKPKAKAKTAERPGFVDGMRVLSYA
jgi:hypothetical protein